MQSQSERRRAKTLHWLRWIVIRLCGVVRNTVSEWPPCAFAVESFIPCSFLSTIQLKLTRHLYKSATNPLPASSCRTALNDPVLSGKALLRSWPPTTGRTCKSSPSQVVMSMELVQFLKTASSYGIIKKRNTYQIGLVQLS